MPSFTQFDDKGFLKVGTREIDKAIGDALIRVAERSERIRDNLLSTVDDARQSLANIAGAYIRSVLAAGKLSLVEANENDDGSGYHAHRGLYHMVENWPVPAVGLRVPVRLGLNGETEVMPASWDSLGFLGVSDWITPAPASTGNYKGRVLVGGIIQLPELEILGFAPNDTVYVGDGTATKLFAKSSDVPVGKYLVPMGVYQGQNVLKLIDVPATLKT